MWLYVEGKGGVVVLLGGGGGVLILGAVFHALENLMLYLLGVGLMG